MSLSTVTCPKCKHQFTADEAIQNQVQEDVKKLVDEEKEKYRKQMIAWKEEIAKDQEENEKKLKESIESQLKSKIQESVDQELKLLKEENEAKKQELEKMREAELKLRLEKNKLEDDKKAFELEKQRQLDEAKKEIEQSVAARMLEDHRMKDAEKDKQMKDMQKTIEELQLKSQLTSQQLQGEVQELELEQTLKAEFPFDEILPVPKGVNGADVIQKVYDSNARFCGTIIWESKRTKNWSEEWIQKLKDDLRLSKADVAILVSSALPDGIKNFGFKDGILITSFENFLGVTKLTRMKIVELCLAKLSTVGQNEKKELIYNYLRGNEFKMRVEAIVESFTALKVDLEKEKQIFTKMWAKREKQIQRVIDNMLGMHGDLHGLMGASLPEISSLEFSEIDLIETSQSDKHTSLSDGVLDSNVDDVVN